MSTEGPSEDQNASRRKLASIMEADVVEYSRLMSVDEERTLETLKKYRAVFHQLIGRYLGRVFGHAGDSIIAEFPSAVEAVRCAIAIQEELYARNQELEPDRQMWFRIGINVGDVLIEGDNLYGDGVNIAARVETLAQPGGICISGSVHELVRNKVSFGFEDLGAQHVKNIAAPISAYSVISARPDEYEPPAVRSDAARKRTAAQWRVSVFVPVLVIVVAIIAISGLYLLKGWLVLVPSGDKDGETGLQGTAPDISWFVGRKVVGRNTHNGRIVMQLHDDGLATLVVTPHNQNKPAWSEDGRWFINQLEMFCFQFENGRFAGGERRCRKIEVRDGTIRLVAGEPSKPVWTLLPRENGE